MDLLIKPGRISYGVAVACFGAHYLLHVSKLIDPPPGPPWFPGPAWMSAIAGLGMFVLGSAIALDWKGRWAALILGLSLLIRVAVVHLPRLLADLHDPGPWTSGAEMLSICGGAFVLGQALSPELEDRDLGGQITTARIGEILFAVPLTVVGVQHFLYATFIATLLPSWIPAHLFWAYFVGVAFFAAMLAIFFRTVVPLAPALLGLMFLLWVLILHAPRVVASPHDGKEWTSMFVALAMCGSAWAVAASTATPVQP